MNMKVVVVSNQDKNQNNRKQNQDEGGGRKRMVRKILMREEQTDDKKVWNNKMSIINRNICKCYPTKTAPLIPQNSIYLHITPLALRYLIIPFPPFNTGLDIGYIGLDIGYIGLDI